MVIYIYIYIHIKLRRDSLVVGLSASEAVIVGSHPSQVIPKINLVQTASVFDTAARLSN